MGGLNYFFLLVDTPETYQLPPRPRLPSRSAVPGRPAGWGSALVAGAIGLLSFRQRGMAAFAAADDEPVLPPPGNGAPLSPVGPETAPARPVAARPRRPRGRR